IGLGRNTRATGQASAALGWGTTTTGTASFAAGSGITAAGAFSAVLGRSSAARGTGNVAIGSFLRAGPAENAMAIGSGIDAADSLVNDIENSLVVGFGDTTAALFVGGPENRVGVRTTAPAADLDVAGKVRADSLQIPTGAEDGYVLTSDASGNAAWQPGGVESDGDWTVIEQIGPDNLIANVDGHVGIGADYPRMKLSLAGDGGILAKGELYEGVRLDSGRTGPEMLWYPRKAAFRAGEVSSSHDWTHDNMGYWSTAFGDAVRASGDGSVAIGLNLHSSGENAFTIGSGLGIQLERRLTNDIDNSFLIGFGDTTATFFVGGPDGRVGVKTTAPAADLDVAGTVRTEAFHMPTGAADGYVLTSDAAGEASWASPAVLSDGDWTVNGSNMSSNVAGNVGVGTSSPGYKLDVNGTMRVSNPGGANTTLVLRDSNGSSDRPGIRFENNSLHYITGDDASDEVFYFAGKNSNARSYDAILRVMGSASDSWGTYTEITHDGTDGHVVTDTGDLYLEPEGDVRIGAAANPTDLVVSGVVNTDSLYRIKSEPFLEVRDSDCLLIGGAIGGAGSDNCVAIGEDAKGFGSENTSVGYNAGCSHAGWEIGNTCVGSNANGKGNYNTYVGADVGTKEGGDRNVFIGVGVRPDDGPGDSSSDNVIIGYKAGRFLSNVNNKLLIANDSTANDILIYGDFEEHKVGIGPQTDLLGTLTLNGYWGNSVVFNTGSHWYMGVDDSNDDKFSVGTGSTLGQNVRLSLDENGMAHFSGRPDGDDSSYVTLNDNGVALRAQSVDSIAVRVFSDNSYGLRSITQEQEALVGYSTNDRALFTHSDNSLAAFFDGDVMIAGWISKASGSFLIDHPLDPENKLLRHNFVESPENLLVYRGTVTLGGDGEGTVTMPDYFEALAKETEATVNLSTVGKPFLTGYEWNADHVSFTVYGDPGREVGWMVMADRDDPVMRRFARPVEERKTADSKICPPGRLLYPEAYGYPESKSSEYEERRALREGR
ncbi:MAG: hypothetical protein JW958_12350, partial [Candidatus Eisenbacteria bacterium]|nr:hypothetical protein [Candidatus Eisenbacteria bacterium]